MTAPEPIRVADPSEAHAVTALITEAIADLDVSRWLVPHDGERLRVLYGVIRIHVEDAIGRGQVLVAGAQFNAVVVWRRQGYAGRPQLIPDYNQRLALATGRHLSRFLQLRRALARRCPDRPHGRLEFVASAHRNTGLASALLAHVHDRSDLAGMPIHAVAVDDRSRRFLHRHRYLDEQGPVDLPGGPPLWPLIRPGDPPP